MNRHDPSVQFVVFADDWGVHPSSCQHLVSRLLTRWPVLWVNTIGTRLPRPTAGDALKVIRKVAQWTAPGIFAPGNLTPGAAAPTHAPELTVINPRMWPGFRNGWQRQINARLISRAVLAELGAPRPNQQRIGITTLPITADLPPLLHLHRWVYYCVDDFSVWPGLDGQVMAEMEKELLAQVDEVVAVSPVLMEHLRTLGHEPHLLTHGIDLEHWTHPERQSAPQWLVTPQRPLLLFWGLVDSRLDDAWLVALSQALPEALILLVGPQQSPSGAAAHLPNVLLPGPVDYAQLPAVAKAADVLIMPYADLPVTRAMSPLKFKEYLACGKPVVARNLPSVTEWADAADLVDSAQQFAAVVRQRLATGLPAEQRSARARLQAESWDRKAAQFADYLLAA